MIPAIDERVIAIVAPGTASTSATASAKVDTATFDYLAIDCVFPVASATNSSAKWLALSLSEGDTTAFSSAASIASFSGTTNSSSATGFVIQPQNDTGNAQITRLLVDCRPRKRYLFLTFEAGASHSTVAVNATLSRPELAPATDGARGLNVNTVIG